MKKLFVNLFVITGVLYTSCVTVVDGVHSQAVVNDSAVAAAVTIVTVAEQVKELEIEKYIQKIEETEVLEVVEIVAEEPVPVGIAVNSRESIEFITDYEYELLAKCVMAESGGELFQGQYMVAEVILNRVEDSEYPDTIEAVITQRYQFTTWGNGMIANAVPTESVYQAVDQALEVRELPADVIFFSSEGYQSYGEPYTKYQNHYFSRKR